MATDVPSALGKSRRSPRLHAEAAYRTARSYPHLSWQTRCGRSACLCHPCRQPHPRLRSHLPGLRALPPLERTRHNCTGTVTLLRGWPLSAISAARGRRLGPVHTIRASSVASENRARRGGVRSVWQGPHARTTTKYGPISAATRRDGANFPGFVVTRRSKIPDIRRSSLLELRKIGSRRRRPNSVNRP